jgi:DNA-directed RNA polymerase sigma subunit (sigma70/sigma32)
LEPDQLVQTCSLDVAEHQGVTLEGVAEILNLTRERVRQIEASALARLGGRAAVFRHLAPDR